MKMHPFEAAGLGQAPFKCIGLFQIPSPQLLQSNPSAYNNMMREMPKGFGCGTCAFCGMALKYNFLITSADGKKFSVGSECVRKTNDVTMARESGRYKKRMDSEKRALKRLEARKSMLDAQRQANGGLTNEELYLARMKEKEEAYKLEAQRKKDKAGPLQPLADRLQDGMQGFRDSIAHGLRKGELPKGRGKDIMTDILSKQKGRRDSKAYLAECENIEKILSNFE